MAEVCWSALAEASCSARLHCAEWSCVVFNDSPRHHSGFGRNWPYKSVTRKLLLDRGAPRRLSAAGRLATNGVYVLGVLEKLRSRPLRAIAIKLVLMGPCPGAPAVGTLM